MTLAKDVTVASLTADAIGSLFLQVDPHSPSVPSLFRRAERILSGYHSNPCHRGCHLPLPSPHSSSLHICHELNKRLGEEYDPSEYDKRGVRWQILSRPEMGRDWWCLHPQSERTYGNPLLLGGWQRSLPSERGRDSCPPMDLTSENKNSISDAPWFPTSGRLEGVGTESKTSKLSQEYKSLLTRGTLPPRLSKHPPHSSTPLPDSLSSVSTMKEGIDLCFVGDTPSLTDLLLSSIRLCLKKGWDTRHFPTACLCLVVARRKSHFQSELSLWERCLSDSDERFQCHPSFPHRNYIPSKQGRGTPPFLTLSSLVEEVEAYLANFE